MSHLLRRAVFLDRDGTINEEAGYLSKIEDCRFIPGSIEAISRLSAAGFLVVIVTNQSGIARGYYSEADMLKLHRHMDTIIASGGGKVDGWYFCPHHPDHGPKSDVCDCRKPLPGMLYRAADDLRINLGSSWMIGDKIADFYAGKAAGCRSLLVKTGYGEKYESNPGAGIIVFDDLLAAADYILTSDSKE